ncbi:hypothetical protein ABMA27_013595 [Loxostege sticticalis]|uniref:Endonuclease/exonuclease/phosphatase domain-containing protein n=1 Tax=Loxostege sticticalis TaxID=481309 RepID=A0ABR3IFV7_LOXSC
MRAQRNETRSPCEPISDRRCAASGARSVKLVTGHGGVGDQALHGNSTTGNSIKLRNLQTIGTWNVHRVGVNICGLSEIHWKGSGHLLTDHHVVYFSGNDISSSNGVGFLIPIYQNNCVMGYEPVSDRIISIKLKSSPMNLNIVQVYAPTSTASDEAIEKFYSELEYTMAKVPSRELLIILGDLNSKIGENANQLSKCAGRFGLGKRNERGERLLQFASENDLLIANSLFEHHPRRLYTWVSPDGKTRNQIDYIMIRSRWRSSITNAHTLPGADCGSDHQLLISKLKLKLTAARVIKQTRKLEVKDVPRFRSVVERNWSQWSEADLSNETTDALWDRAKSLIVSAVSEATPPIRTHKKQHWMTDDTFKLVEKRQKMKATGADIKDLNNIFAKIQLKCRQDHNSYLRNICTEVEAHADRYKSRDLYHKIRLITKTLPVVWLLPEPRWRGKERCGRIATSPKPPKSGSCERWYSQSSCTRQRRGQCACDVSKALKKASSESDVVIFAAVEDVFAFSFVVGYCSVMVILDEDSITIIVIGTKIMTNNRSSVQTGVVSGGLLPDGCCRVLVYISFRQSVHGGWTPRHSHLQYQLADTQAWEPTSSLHSFVAGRVCLDTTHHSLPAAPHMWRIRTYIPPLNAPSTREAKQLTLFSASPIRLLIFEVVDCSKEPSCAAYESPQTLWSSRHRKCAVQPSTCRSRPVRSGENRLTTFLLTSLHSPIQGAT